MSRGWFLRGRWVFFEDYTSIASAGPGNWPPGRAIQRTLTLPSPKCREVSSELLPPVVVAVATMSSVVVLPATPVIAVPMAPAAVVTIAIIGSIGAIADEHYGARGRVFPCRGCDRQQRPKQQSESQSQYLDTSHSSLPPALWEEGKIVCARDVLIRYSDRRRQLERLSLTTGEILGDPVPGMPEGLKQRTRGLAISSDGRGRLC